MVCSKYRSFYEYLGQIKPPTEEPEPGTVPNPEDLTDITTILPQDEKDPLLLNPEDYLEKPKTNPLVKTMLITGGVLLLIIMLICLRWLYKRHRLKKMEHDCKKDLAQRKLDNNEINVIKNLSSEIHLKKMMTKAKNENVIIIDKPLATVGPPIENNVDL